MKMKDKSGSAKNKPEPKGIEYFEELYGNEEEEEEDHRKFDRKEFTASRDRDDMGRFRGNRAEVDAYFYSPNKVTWLPNKDYNHIWERCEVKYFTQKCWEALAWIMGGTAVYAFVQALISQ